jgi:hypothetical protein
MQPQPLVLITGVMPCDLHLTAAAGMCKDNDTLGLCKCCLQQRTGDSVHTVYEVQWWHCRIRRYITHEQAS